MMASMCTKKLYRTLSLKLTGNWQLLPSKSRVPKATLENTQTHFFMSLSFLWVHPFSLKFYFYSFRNQWPSLHETLNAQ